MRHLITALMGFAVLWASAHAAMPPAARAEIDGLLARLESSGCQFSRNGSWYPATEAKPHMLQKLKYLEDRGAVQTAEQFIELAGSRSSVSGEPYLVKCGDAAPVTSAAWLGAQLQAMRATGKSRGAP